MKEKRSVHPHIEVVMRLFRIPLLCLVILMMGSEARAQFDCGDVVRSNIDSLRIMETRGYRGDTVLMPIKMRNDSLTTAFFMFFKFDTTKLTPFLDTLYDTLGNIIDTAGLQVEPVGRLANAVSRNQFSASYFQQRRDAMFLRYVPPFIGSSDTLASGNDIVCYFKFVVKNTVNQGDIGNFSWLNETIYIYDTVLGIPESTAVGCNTGQLSQAFWSDFLGNYFDVLTYPGLFTGAMRFVADTTPPKPTIVSFTASQNPVSSGQQFRLRWNVPNADSVRIFANGAFFSRSSVPIDSVPVSITASTIFKLFAWRGVASDSSAPLTVTVSGGPPVGTPSIGLTPNQSSFTTTEGQTVSFTVTASALASGGNITLSASNLPFNASFAPTNPIIGPSPVVGSFSFTPDIGQTGTFTVSFSASNSAGSGSLSVPITVTSLPVDRLFTTSTPKGKPVGGLRGTKGIRLPINVITNKTIYGVQFDMRYQYEFVSLDSFVVTDRIPDYVIYDNIGTVPGRARILTFGLNNEPVVTDTSTAILYAYMSLDSSSTPLARYPVYFDSAFESVNPDPNVAGDTMKTDSGIVDVDTFGDVNLDRDVTVADVVNIVGSIIQNFTLNPRQFATADIIINDSVNVFDLVADINIIFGVPTAPAPPQPAPGPAATVSLKSFATDYVAGQTGTFTIKSELYHKVAGAQFEVSYDPKALAMGRPRLLSDANDFILQYQDNGQGRLRMLLYTMDRSADENGYWQPGSLELVDIPVLARKDLDATDHSKIRISQAMLATGSAASIGVTGVGEPLPSTFLLKQNYPNPFNPKTTISFTVPASSGGAQLQDVSLEVYNILGQHVKTLLDSPLSPGDYKVEWNATSNSGARVATGIYLYRLRVGNESQTRKMLLLK